MNQLFVDTVRAAGGNNAVRNLVCNTYAASAYAPALQNFKLPTDAATDHLIAQVHIYSPDRFAVTGDWITNPTSVWDASCVNELDGIMSRLNQYVVQKGIPLIVGEFGAVDKNNETDRAAFAYDFVSKAKTYGITCFWWDDGGDYKLLDRRSLTWFFPQIVNGLVNGSK